MKTNDLIQKLEEKSTLIQNLLQKLDAHYKTECNLQRLQEIENNIKREIQQLKDDPDNQRKLNIAIMGRVKAGKSSFLNAFLFGGEEILPMASTPKTASLTSIIYAEETELKIEFFTLQEWQSIADKANSGDKISQELLTAAQKNDLDIPAITKERIRSLRPQAKNYSAAIKEINELLEEEYVGEKAKYMPLVKHVYLSLKNEKLKDLRIIDTPGMNDPVQSRSERTRQELSSADVVFFLSNSENFLNKNDIELLMEQIPENNVSRVVIIGSQFDTAVLGECDKYENLQEALIGVQNSLLNNDKNKESLAKIKNIIGEDKVYGPIFCSTHAYLFSQKEGYFSKQNNYQGSYEIIKEVIAEAWQADISKKDWKNMAGFTTIQPSNDKNLLDLYTEIKNDRLKIITDINSKSLEIHQGNISKYFKDSIKAITAKDKSDQEDIEGHKNDIQTYQKLLSVIDLFLQQDFEEIKKEVYSLQNEISDFIQRLSVDYRNKELIIRQGSEIEEDYYLVDDKILLFIWTWGDTKRVYYTKTVSYNYYSLHDAVRIIDDFVDESCNFVNRKQQSLQNDYLQQKFSTFLQNIKDQLQSSKNQKDIEEEINNLQEIIKNTKFSSQYISISNPAKDIKDRFNYEVRDDEARNSLTKDLSSTISIHAKSLNKEIEKIFTPFCHDLEKIPDYLIKIKNIFENYQKTAENHLSQLEKERDTLQKLQMTLQKAQHNLHI